MVCERGARTYTRRSGLEGGPGGLPAGGTWLLAAAFIRDCLSREVHRAVGRRTALLTREQAYILLNDIVRDVLGADAVSLSDFMRVEDIPGWDSLAQIGVLAAAEIRFGVEIRCAEADRLASIGDLVDLILAKAPRLPVA